MCHSKSTSVNVIDSHVLVIPRTSDVHGEMLQLRELGSKRIV